MRNFFSIGAKYTDDDNIKVNTTYIVDALTHTEAIVRLTEELSKSVREEFKIGKVVQSKLAEVHNKEGEWWYGLKTEITTYDEKSNKETKLRSEMLISADTIDEAIEYCNELMNKTFNNWELVGANKKNIADVFFYIPPVEKIVDELLFK